MRSLAVLAAVSLAACASIAGLEAPDVSNDDPTAPSSSASSSSSSSGNGNGPGPGRSNPGTPTSDASPINNIDGGGPPPPQQDTGAPPPPPPELARYELRCNGQVLPLRSCASGKLFEHETCPSSGGRVVILANTGTLPVAYIARSGWIVGGSMKYVPGESGGGGNGEKFGTLGAGQTVDVSGAWGGGYLMVLGSPKPFTPTFMTSPKEGEGQINYSAKGQIGGVPTNVMYIAQVTSGPTPYGNCFSTQPLY